MPPSMRPRPGGRGERPPGHGDAAGPMSFNAATTRRPWRAKAAMTSRHGAGEASMRPRPGGRGEHVGEAVPHGRWWCFNAATTRRPWRASSTTRPRPPPPALQCGHDPEAVESNYIRSHRASRAALQCGHDPEAVESINTQGGGKCQASRFNAATTRRPWRALSLSHLFETSEWLQCGHDPEAVESNADVPAAGQPALASMRPRPGGRGEHLRWPLVTSSRGTLQCGHDPEAVESAINEDGEPATAVLLQCGHDPEAVESVEIDGRDPCRDCELQCGHDPEAVESIRKAASHDERRPASMRPRPGGRGEAYKSSPTWKTRWCFNAATTRRPWRARSQSSRCRRRRAASMRPRPGGRGEHPDGGAEGKRQLRLQCGHDPEAVESVRRRLRQHVAGDASMRPRPGGRGEPGTPAASAL